MISILVKCHKENSNRFLNPSLRCTASWGFETSWETCGARSDWLLNYCQQPIATLASLSPGLDSWLVLSCVDLFFLPSTLSLMHMAVTKVLTSHLILCVNNDSCPASHMWTTFPTSIFQTMAEWGRQTHRCTPRRNRTITLILGN